MHAFRTIFFLRWLDSPGVNENKMIAVENGLIIENKEVDAKIKNVREGSIPYNSNALFINLL